MVRDGALLAFVQGTNPEVWLLLEARADGSGGLQWHYGLAPMTGYAVEASHDGRQVWSSPPQTRPKKPKSSYWIHSFPSSKPAARNR